MNWVLTSLLALGFVKAGQLLKKDQLPKIKGILEVKHSIPGRIRFFAPPLVGSPTQCQDLKPQLEKITIIHQVAISPITGSVVIHYDETEIEPIVLAGIMIKLLGFEDRITQKQPVLLDQKIKTLIKSLDYAVVENSKQRMDIKTSVTLLLLGCEV